MDEVEICNLALTQLGQATISSLGNGTPPSYLCKLYYPQSRDAVLRVYPWNCAKVTSSVGAEDSSPADSNWTYQLAMPTDPYCLWIPKILNEDLEYVVRGRKIWVNEAPATLTYIQRVEDPGLFDPLLIDAIAARLAVRLSIPITGLLSSRKEAWAFYQTVIQEARTQDGMEGESGMYDTNVLADVRL